MIFSLKDGKHLYQWDRERVLIVHDETIDQVHFENSAVTQAIIKDVYEVDGVRLVDIPAVLLQYACVLTAYAFKCDDAREYTYVHEQFKVIERKHPDDYIPPEEHDKWTDLKEDVLQALEDAEAAADKAAESEIAATEIINDELIVTYADGERVNLGNVKGKKGDPGTDGVGIERTYVTTSGDLMITLTDGNKIKAGNIKGPKGDAGDPGEPGQPGEPGSAGEPGISPTVASSREGKVTTVTITDANGAHSFEIHDGENGASTWDGIENKPKTFPPAEHGHTWSEITDVPEDLGGASAWEEVENKPETFPPEEHTHDEYLPVTGGTIEGGLEVEGDLQVHGKNFSLGPERTIDEGVTTAGMLFATDMEENDLGFATLFGGVPIIATVAETGELAIANAKGIRIGGVGVRIGGVVTPAEDEDAAPKKYVDEAVSNSADEIRTELSDSVGGLTEDIINLEAALYEELDAHTHGWQDIENVPKALQFGEVKTSGSGGDTLTWDGDRDLLFQVGNYYKVSDVIPAISYYENPATVTQTRYSDTSISNTYELSFVETSAGNYKLGAYAAIITEEGAGVLDEDIKETFPKPGVYVKALSAWFVSSLTISGYDGFGEVVTAIESLNEKYLPEHSHDIDWENVQNKPFETVGGDTLEWDGNTDGLVNFAEFYKVSDSTPTTNELQNGGIITIFAEGEGKTDAEFSGDVVYSNADGAMVLVNGSILAFAVAWKDNADLSELDLGVFPEKGIYLFSVEGMHLSSLTINGYTGFTGAEVIKTEALPEHLQFGEYEEYGDTLTWDGNTDGLESVDMSGDGSMVLYKISDAMPTQGDIQGNWEISFKLFDGTGGATVSETLLTDLGRFDYSDIPMFLFLNSMPTLVVMPSNYAGFNITGGIYVVDHIEFTEGEAYISSLTINGYTGFITKTVTPLDEKYMPVLKSPSGKKFKITVDDTGTLTATEV